MIRQTAYVLTIALWLSVLSPTALRGQTPGERQVADENWSLPVMSIDDAIVDADSDTVPDRIDEVVHVRGTVVIPPGVLAEQFFQVSIFDGTRGISLFSYEISKELEAGDQVAAIGEVGQYRGAVQLQNIQVRKLGVGSVPLPETMSVEQAASWRQFGRPLTVAGRIGEVELKTNGTLPMTGEDGGVITLFFPQKVMRNFPFADYPPGARVEATGVVSIYDQSWPFDGGFQLVVTSTDDLNLLEAPVSMWRQALIWIIPLGFLLLLLGGGLGWIYHRRQKEGARELATLNRLSGSLSVPELTGPALAQQACEALVESGLMRSVLVHLFDDDGVLRLAGAAGDSAASRLTTLPSQSGGADVDQLKAEFRQVSLQLVSVVPIQAGEQSIGILTALDRQAGSPTPSQQRALLTAAQLLGLGLANRLMQRRALASNQELKQLATTDELTELYNRRFLGEYLHVHFSMAQRSGQSFAFLAIDLDHFKKINDSLGHTAGDRVLQCVARCLQQRDSHNELPVRMGGEEFLVVMPQTSLNKARRAGEAIRQCVESVPWQQELGTDADVTVSVGVAVFPDHGTDVDVLLEAADSALYASKRAGRNRVTVCGEEATSAKVFKE